MAKKWLTDKYKMMDLGDLKQFLRIQIERERKAKIMLVGQERYIRRILE